MGRIAALAIAVLVFLSVVVLHSASAGSGVDGVAGPGVAGATPAPYSHDLTFENDTQFPADGLFVELSDYTWQVDVLQQPDRCPDPDVDTGFGFSANVTWGVTCVRVGESVTLRVFGECDKCPPPDTTTTWGHETLGNADCTPPTNSIDAALLLQLVAGLIGAIPCETNADFNGDGALDAVDALLILQLDAGLISA